MSKKNAELPPGAVDVAGLGAPYQPQVNLLPPEVRAKRSLGRIKAWLVVVLLAVVALAAAGYVWSMSVENEALEELAEKESEVMRLQAEQAEYSDVPRVKGMIASTQEALETSTATEVLWPELLGSIQATLPETVRLLDLSTSLPGPAKPETLSGNPLDPPAVGSVDFTARASVLPDLALWMDELMTIPAVVGVVFDTADYAVDDDVVGYDISVTVQIDAGVYALRHVEIEEGE